MAGLKAVGEIFKFAGTLTDSTQRRERYELLLDKQVQKALNSGEKTFDLWADFCLEISPLIKDNKKAKYMLKRYIRRIHTQKQVFQAND